MTYDQELHSSKCIHKHPAYHPYILHCWQNITLLSNVYLCCAGSHSKLKYQEEHDHSQVSILAEHIWHSARQCVCYIRTMAR